MKMNYFDLFAGIGGFALGAYKAGWRFDNHYFSEVDEYAIRVYRQHFPEAIPCGDITKMDTDSLPVGEWIITGGFPCQDISVAGKGAGIRGSRSGLWFEMWRIIRDLRPQIVIAENVGAITFRGLNRVLSSLAEIGYDAEWQDIRASDVGAPHRRERIWIVAYPSIERTGRLSIRQRRSYETTCYSSRSSQDVADAECQPGYAGANAEGRERRHEPTQLATAESGWWAAEPNVGRVAHGIPSRVHRLKCLGNSIVPQIAEVLFRQIAEQLRNKEAV